MMKEAKDIADTIAHMNSGDRGLLFLEISKELYAQHHQFFTARLVKELADEYGYHEKSGGD